MRALSRQGRVGMERSGERHLRAFVRCSDVGMWEREEREEAAFLAWVGLLFRRVGREARFWLHFECVGSMVSSSAVLRLRGYRSCPWETGKWWWWNLGVLACGHGCIWKSGGCPGNVCLWREDDSCGQNPGKVWDLEMGGKRKQLKKEQLEVRVEVERG